MKVVVFGASGPTGRLLVRQLVDAGHSAVAVTRRPESFLAGDTQVSVVQADVFERHSVGVALDGSDAVLSVLGVPFTRQQVDTFSTGTANIVSAMRRDGISRLAVVSSTGAHHYRNRRNASLSLQVFEPIISRTIGKTVYDDLRRMENIVTESGLDWTIVRPSTLFDGDQVTGYIAGDVPPVGAFTARTDLAHYLTTLVEDTASFGTMPIVSTTEGVPTFWQKLRREMSKSN